jgi:uncharacterized membrane protein
MSHPDPTPATARHPDPARAAPPLSTSEVPRRARVERWLGGSAPSVLVKLLLLSLIVGALMAFLGLSPMGLLQALVNFVRSILDLGSEAVRDVLTWVVTGALVVVPLWLLLRVFSRR